MKRHFQMVAVWALAVITLLAFGMTPFGLFGIAVVGLTNEEFGNQRLFWQLWPLLRVFLVLAGLWLVMIFWMRRTERKISD